jgi:hypothetical protein
MKKVIIGLLSLFSLCFGQFKFGISPLAYSVIVNPGFPMPKKGLGAFVEFGGLIGDYAEIGVQLGAQIYFLPNKYEYNVPTRIPAPVEATLTELYWGAGNTTQVFYSENMSGANINAMPYFRYYFLDAPLFRPYVFTAVGFTVNLFQSGDLKDMPAGAGLQSTFAKYYGVYFGAKLGFGLRILKIMDFGITYYYMGNMSYQKPNNNNVSMQQALQAISFIDSNLKKSYNLHSLNFTLSIALGGNIE